MKGVVSTRSQSEEQFASFKEQKVSVTGTYLTRGRMPGNYIGKAVRSHIIWTLSGHGLGLVVYSKHCKTVHKKYFWFSQYDTLTSKVSQTKDLL